MSALKNDTEKSRMELVPAGAVLAIADVFTFGAKKYAAHNWRKGFDWSRLIGALERHIAAFKEGEDLDPESGLPHMAHAGCCVMMLLEHQRLKYGNDDRYTKDPIIYGKVYNPPPYAKIRTHDKCLCGYDVWKYNVAIDDYECEKCGQEYKKWPDIPKNSSSKQEFSNTNVWGERR
jgi:hypothetical protein